MIEEDIFEELKHHRNLLAAAAATTSESSTPASPYEAAHGLLAAHLGAVVDGVRALVSTALAEEYCDTHNILHSVAFSLNCVR